MLSSSIDLHPPVGHTQRIFTPQPLWSILGQILRNRYNEKLNLIFNKHDLFEKRYCSQGNMARWNFLTKDQYISVYDMYDIVKPERQYRSKYDVCWIFLTKK